MQRARYWPRTTIASAKIRALFSPLPPMASDAGSRSHHRGGETSIYYLEATKARPDFKLRFDPDKLAVSPGTSAACYVQVDRERLCRPVAVTLEGMPAGLAASPLTIPPSMTQGLVVVTATPDARRDAKVFRVVGTAVVTDVQGAKKSIVRDAVAREEIYLPGGGRGLFDIDTAVAAVTSANDIVKVQVEPQEVTLVPGQEVRLKVRIQRRPDFNKGVSLDVLLRHLGKIFGNPLPPGVTLAEDKSKTLIGTGNEGVIVLRAAADAKPIEHVPISVLANVSVNFMVKMSYSSPVVWLSVRKAR